MAAGVLAWCTQAMASVGVTIPNDLLLKLHSMGLVYFFAYSACIFFFFFLPYFLTPSSLAPGGAPQIVASDGCYIRS